MWKEKRIRHWIYGTFWHENLSQHKNTIKKKKDIDDSKRRTERAWRSGDYELNFFEPKPEEQFCSKEKGQTRRKRCIDGSKDKLQPIF